MLHFIGQLHPIVVHFPVALLVVAALVLLGTRLSPGDRTWHAVGLLLWGGAIGGVVSAAVGFTLSSQSFYGGADRATLDVHAILGYATAALACVAVALRARTRRGDRRALVAHVVAVVGAVTVSVCGYFGGELVHGHNHLMAGFSDAPAEPELASLEPPAEVAGASRAEPDTLVFRRDVRPILKASCFKCHSAKKREGGLRLDTRDGALAGGDTGPAVVPGDLAGSLLIERIRLPAHHDDYMPSKGDPLTAVEVARLEKWVEQGARYF